MNPPHVPAVVGLKTDPPVRAETLVKEFTFTRSSEDRWNGNISRRVCIR